MKIKKLVESKLLEDDDLNIIDPKKDSEEEIKDAVEANDSDLSDKEAEEKAQDLKAEAEEANAVLAITDEDFEDTVVRNALVNLLDKHLKIARYLKKGEERGAKMKSCLNVLIEGLPGSGKTSIVETWCKANDLVLVAMSSTDPKLEAAVNGMPLRDQTQPETNALAYAYSADLNVLLADDPVGKDLAGKCILFVDEFNRQKNEQLRRPLMSLFNEKRDARGVHDFRRNLLFTIICNNPEGVITDKGTSKMNYAETDRFYSQWHKFNSNAEDSKAYFDGWIKDTLLRFDVIPPNSKASERRNGFVGPREPLSKDDREYVENCIRAYELAKYVLNQSERQSLEIFSTEDDLDDIDQENARLLSSRSFSDLILNNIVEGKNIKKAVLEQVDKFLNVTDKCKRNLHKILDHYIVDEKELWYDYGLEKDPNAAKVTPAAPKVDPKKATGLKDDDTGLFGDDEVAAAGNKASAKTTSTNDEIEDIMASWGV